MFMIQRIAIALCMLVPASLCAQAAEIESTPHYFRIDSGLVSNNLSGPAAIGLPQVVWSTVVSIDGVSWLRLNYGSVLLSGSPNPSGDGSFLRMTSMRDGAVMTQHMRHVDEWQNTSAYFNGDAVLVELLAQPGTGANRLIIKGAIAGPINQKETDSICGTVDDRQPSSDDRCARVMPIGCSAWMINDCNHCFLSAGHCNISGSQVIQFNTPLSSGAGTPQAPPPSDQYAIDSASIQEQSGGTFLGNDWAYFGCFDNSTTGLSPYASQGSVAFDLVNPPSVGTPAQTIRITGYGTTSSPVTPTWNQAQKTHTGPYFDLSSDVIQYTVDTTGGNSGSPVIIEGTNDAIGIHTNAGCNSVGGNQGCASTNPDLQAALANPLGVCSGTCGGTALTTTFANNNGGAVGGAVYFALEGVLGGGGVTIADLDLNCTGTGGVAGTIDVYFQSGSAFDPLGSWVLMTSGSGTTAPAGSPSNFVLNTPLLIGEGCVRSVAIVANGFGHAYTTATTLPLVYADSYLRLTGGSASNVAFSGTVFSPRLVNTTLNYTVGGSCGGLATAVSEGVACVDLKTSFYEQLSPASMDLSGQQIRAVNGPTGYSITMLPSTIQPVGTVDPLAVPLALGDDVQVGVGTLGFTVGSNCQVARGPGNSNQWSPTVAGMLGNPADAMYAWTDLQPDASGSGLVTYEESGTQWMVTYDGVYLWGTTDPVTVQFRGNESNGNFVIAFGSLGTTGPEDWLVGYSVGGPSDDPGSRDLSLTSLFPFSTATVDADPLTLAAVGTPVLGQPFDLTTNGIEPSAVFHLGVIGLTAAGLPLSFVSPSAHPQCRINAAPNVVVGPTVIFGGSGSHTWQGLDLTSVGIVGFDLWFQSVTLDLSGISASTRTSNAIKATTGF